MATNTTDTSTTTAPPPAGTPPAPSAVPVFSPDQAGQAFLDFIRYFYRDNALVSGGLALDGEMLDLASLKLPILNIYATRDHLVPPASSRALASLVPGADYREHAFDGGHIGVYLSARAQREIPDVITAFLDGDGRS